MDIQDQGGCSLVCGSRTVSESGGSPSYVAELLNVCCV